MLHHLGAFERNECERFFKVCPRQILVRTVRRNVAIVRDIGELSTTFLDEHLASMGLYPSPDFFELHHFSRTH